LVKATNETGVFIHNDN